MKDFILKAFSDSAAVKQQFAHDHADRIAQVAALMVTAFREGRKVLLFGNGGSATPMLEGGYNLTALARSATAHVGVLMDAGS